MSFLMSRFIRSPPGRYSMTKYKFYKSWKEHLSWTTQGFLSEIASTFLYYLDCTTLFLKIISDFFSFLTATGSLVFVHLHSLTSPNAPLPMIFTDGKSLIVNLILSCLRSPASSWSTFLLSIYCSFSGMPSICILRLSWSQYSFFCCSWVISFEYRCSMKLFAASTFSFVAFDMII